MKTPHVAFPVLLLAAVVLSARAVSAQDARGWRAHFAAGEEARQAGDAAAYARAMADAARAIPDGLLNRPFVQYHAARAAALAGRPREAIAWLVQAWEEDIESLMISYAAHDPAFEAVADSDAYLEVMDRAAGMELSVRTLAEGVHLLGGAGSNVLAVVDGPGALLVDTGYRPALPALRSALASLGVTDVRCVVLTHAHEDHVGGTPELGADAVVVGHPGTASAMTEPFTFIEGVTLPPKPAQALPEVRIDADTTFTFGAHRIRIVPTVAHTAGDLSVYLPDARVAHLGDTWLAGNPMMYPGTDDPDAFLDDIEALLDGMHPETVVVGGHDPPTDLAAVRAQIVESREAMALVRGAFADELSLEETVERAGDRFPPQWIAFFHRQLDPGR